MRSLFPCFEDQRRWAKEKGFQSGLSSRCLRDALGFAVVVKKEALCPPVKSFDEEAEEVEEDERILPEPTNPLEQ